MSEVFAGISHDDQQALALLFWLDRYSTIAHRLREIAQARYTEIAHFDGKAINAATAEKDAQAITQAMFASGEEAMSLVAELQTVAERIAGLGGTK